LIFIELFKRSESPGDPLENLLGVCLSEAAEGESVASVFFGAQFQERFSLPTLTIRA
jgi:hypothetical protein